MEIARVMLIWICLPYMIQGDSEVCVLDYGCECFLRYGQVRCAGKSLSHISKPYRLAFLEYTHLDYSNNMIGSIVDEELQQWSRLDYLDLRGNPLTASSCEAIERFTEATGATVLSDCRCVLSVY